MKAVARSVTGVVPRLNRPIIAALAPPWCRSEVPVEGGTGGAVASPATSTLRDEMAVSAQRLLASASGQIPMAGHT